MGDTETFYVGMSQDPKESEKGICYTFFVLTKLAMYELRCGERLWFIHGRSSGPTIRSLEGPITVTEEFYIDVLQCWCCNNKIKNKKIKSIKLLFIPINYTHFTLINLLVVGMPVLCRLPHQFVKNL